MDDFIWIEQQPTIEEKGKKEKAKSNMSLTFSMLNTVEIELWMIKSQNR